MHDHCTISVIIPHFMKRECLRNTLESIARQDFPAKDVQVIVVEDNATYEGKHVLSEDFPFVEFLKCFSHVGAACAKNIGARRARNVWLAFLDDDVELEKTWLSVMMNAAMNTPNIRCFQSKVLSREHPGVLKSTGGVANQFGYAWDRGVNEPDLSQFDERKRILFASSCAMLIKKDLFDATGGFDNDLFYMGEDYDLGLRLYIKGEEILYVPQAVCFHADQAQDKENLLKKKYYIERNRLVILLKNYEIGYLAKLFIPLLFLKWLKYFLYVVRFKGRRLKYAGDVISGWAWILRHLGEIAQKRAVVDASRQRRICDIFSDFDEYKSYLASVAPNSV